MREARPDDWLSLIGMSKFEKGASGEKQSWMFTYGRNPDDALLVMAEALASGNNPYETKVPQMASTVGATYRKLMFSWIEQRSSKKIDFSKVSLRQKLQSIIRRKVEIMWITVMEVGSSQRRKVAMISGGQTT
jgi:hypothetical protein